ncbi:peptidyl-tRNA hydrolase [Niveomyces insectorum RCEF 264]|uniref:Peptidyl-tRNA hydrolase n=1 Tax=Niveomyces insectorum RCEF 264 TaxID=1081102 RepID=A0A167TU13_9HYPO|nr:peptidyl-tRNA hydrolase [Niveomyces insectorum RCEF 264]
MRFSTTSALLALPLLGAAAEDGGLFGQYRAQFQNFLGSMGVGAFEQQPAAEPASAGGSTAGGAGGATAPGAGSQLRPTQALTLNNWKNTLYQPVQPGATEPEEWWVLITGRNKTCFGHCGTIEKAFGGAAPKLASIPNGPHTGVINCDDQPVLCNSWSASPGYLYVFEMLPKPAKTDIFVKRLNLTTTTPETIYDLYESGSKENFHKLDGNFHPLDGTLATNGLAVPIGYVLWFFNVVPNWLFMILVSFLSRSMMSRRMAPPGGAAGRPAAGAQQ